MLKATDDHFLEQKLKNALKGNERNGSRKGWNKSNNDKTMT